MSFKCASGDRELLSIDFDAEGWEDLRVRNRKDRALKMTCCSGDVTLRQTKFGTQYFAHVKKGSCAAGTDPPEVMLARELIAKAVRRAGWNFSVEAARTSPVPHASSAPRSAMDASIRSQRQVPSVDA